MNKNNTINKDLKNIYKLVMIDELETFCNGSSLCYQIYTDGDLLFYNVKQGTLTKEITPTEYGDL